MDANGTPYHLLLGERDWRPVLDASATDRVVWDPDRASVGLASRVPRVGRRRAGRLVPSDRRGAAIDRFGTWYWIDADSKRIRVAPNADPRVGTYWASDRPISTTPFSGTDFAPQDDAPAPKPQTLRGLTVTTHHFLVAGTLEPAGLLIFDLHAGGPPIWHGWPPTLAFAPFDLAPARDGGVWILDRDRSGTSRVFRLDRHFRITDLGAGSVELTAERSADFAPVDSEGRPVPAVVFPKGLELGLSSPAGIESPVALLELPDASLLILDNPTGSSFSLIHRIADGSVVGDPVALENALAPILPAASADRDLLAHDFAYLPASEDASLEPGTLTGTLTGALFLAAAEHSQSFAFALTVSNGKLSLTVCPRTLPMRRWSGKALVAADDEVYYDFEERWLPLTEHPRRRFAPRGTLESIVLDGRIPGCRWHRLLLDACIPNGSVVSIASRAADDHDRLGVVAWQEEPRPYLRATGSELPFHRPFTVRDLAREGTGTWELLLQRAEGRYIELRVTLVSDGRSSPWLRALRVYHPRFSYLDKYLPAIYRDAPGSASFLDRFLANIEGILTATEDKIAQAQMLFDSRTAPDAYLDWLAGWLGARLDPRWDESRKRLFLAHAPLLFRWRGTARGLLAAIRIAVEPCPDHAIFTSLASGAAGTPTFGDVRLVEHHTTRALPTVALGDPTEPEGPAIAGGAQPWRPSMGAAALHSRWAGFLRDRYRDLAAPADDARALAGLNAAWRTGLATFEGLRFSPVLPASQPQAVDWSDFIDRSLSIPYAHVTDGDGKRFRAFLGQRYVRIEELNVAHRLSGALAHPSFATVTLPGENEMPEGGQRLVDWVDFASLALPIARRAHRFTVLVPITPRIAPATRAERLARVREIVAREKPAHTTFDVKPYWALFQVGGARLGIDTVLGEGARFVAVVLGATFTGESFLAESHPWNVENRSVLGRDASMEI